MKKVIGIDIGGTKINGAIISENGEILKRSSIPTFSNNSNELVVDRIKTLIDDLIVDEVQAIGIATAGFIDSENGIIVFAGNIEGFTGLHLKEVIESYVNIPVYVGNDANGAALAEKWLGEAKSYNSFVMLTMGTGLGGAIYHNKLGFWEGSNFQGAELGHIVLYPNGRLCTCGQKGCAEKYIAGSALSINYEELTGKSITGPEIINRLEEDDNAKIALNRLAKDLGIYLSSIKNIFDPEGLIIGGGFIESANHWLDIAIDSYESYCNRPEGMKISIAKFLNDAGFLGAAKFALDNIGD